MPNTTTPQALQLSSNQHTIFGIAPYSGDDNGDNTCLVQYRQTGTSTWFDLLQYFKAGDQIHPMIDRRATIKTQGGGTITNTFAKQCRFKIFNLTPDTQYDVQAIFSDDDNGGALTAVTASIFTKTFTPQVASGTAHVGTGQTYSDIPSAIASGAGDIILHTGTPTTAINITTSGAAGAFKRLRLNPGAVVTIAGASDTPCIRMNANYWIIQDLALTASPNDSSMRFAVGAHDIYLERLTGVDVAPSIPYPNERSAFEMPDQVGPTIAQYNVYFISCNFVTTAASLPTEPQVDGIKWGSVRDCIIYRCTFDNFWDSIGNGRNQTDGFLGYVNSENIDMYENILLNHRDDSYEWDGTGLGCASWLNKCTTSSNVGGSGLAASCKPVWLGPTYLISEVYDLTATTSSGFKFDEQEGMITLFVFHCLVKTSGASGDVHETVAGAGSALFLNNIFHGKGNMYYFCYSGIEANFNCYHQANAPYDFANTFHPVGGGTADYANFAAWKAGTGYDANSINADPLLNVDYTIGATSPCKNAGMSIPNINDATGLRPAQGGSPDIGPFELGGALTILAGDTITAPTDATTKLLDHRLKTADSHHHPVKQHRYF